MRRILIAAAGIAACGLLASTTAQAQTFQQGAPNFEPGGPARIGSWCKVNADGGQNTDAYGFYTPCAVEAEASQPTPEPRRMQRRY